MPFRLEKPIADYLLSLREAPYTAWEEGMDVFTPEAPFFGSAATPPSPAEVFAGGTNCAGLMNIVRLAHGLEPLGGTPGWERALQGKWLPLDRNAEYPANTLLLRKYRCDYEDEGHLGMLWTGGGPVLEQKFYHSWRGGGVTLDDTLAESDAWEEGGYYELVCLPEDWLLV